ncbi:hypothetical protein JB92DRAFT_2824662 [Gautieria morchelliformis]|nr:hypothetical protein JB92DRAFT_2824662 [Gautieria morchelliformis]
MSRRGGLCWTSKKSRQIRIQTIDKGRRPAIPSTALSVLRLPSMGIKDSVTDLKTTVMTIGKTIGMLEESTIPGLTQQIKDIEELVNKLAHMRTLDNENESILGTLTAQYEDLTKLDMPFYALEENSHTGQKGV